MTNINPLGPDRNGGRPGQARARGGQGAKGEMPGWTNGLRQLYDQVVDEDLPDSFRDLLAQLDQPKR